MICPRPDCPIEFTARAMDAFIKREQEQFGFPFNPEMETCEHCAMCNGKLICWKRLADGETRRVVKDEEANAA